jgi:hypothetical protein
MVQSSKAHAELGHDRLTQNIEVDEAEEDQHGLDSVSQSSGDAEVADEDDDGLYSMQEPYFFCLVFHV